MEQMCRESLMKFVLQSFYGWYRNTIRHPRYRWFVIIGTLVYLLSPIDISPDLIPIVGWIDDGLLASLLVAEVSSLMMSMLNRKSEDSQESDRAEGPVIDVTPH